VTFLCTGKEKLPARPQAEWKPCSQEQNTQELAALIPS
jgi:hypothetical protein